MPAFQSEDKLLSFLDKIDEETADARGDVVKRMEENQEILRGKVWKGKSTPTFLYNIIENCFEDKVGKLSETKPTMAVLAARSGLGGAAETLHRAVSSIWDTKKMEFKSERIAAFGAIAGVAFVGTPFNPNANYGTGDIDIVVKDPRTCGTDLCITNAEDADMGEYMTVEDFVSLDVIGSMYPGRGALVKPDERLSGYRQPSEPPSAGSIIKWAYRQMMNRTKQEGQSRVSVIPKAILKEYYIQDRRKSIDDLGVVPIVDGLTKYAEDGSIPFPGGRRILRAGDILLEDCYNHYWDGRPPLDMMSWKIDLESAWTGDEIQGVKRMAEAQNRLGDAYAKTALLNGVVRVIMDSGALSPEERNKLSNEAGQIITKQPGRELQYMVPQLLPPEILVFIDKLHEWIRQKIGVTQAPTQKQVPSIVTGPAIEGLQLMIETPIRTAARRVEEFYQRVGNKLISRVFQFYTSDRLLHLIEPNGKWAEFEFERMKILQDKNGKPRSKEDQQKAYRDFYFTIEPGSSLAVTKTQRAAMKMALVQMGLLHPKEVFMESGMLNWEDKIKDAKRAKEEGLFDVITGGRGPGQSGAEALSKVFTNGAGS